MLRVPDVMRGMFPQPTLFFTLAGQSRSEAVLDALGHLGQQVQTFASPEAIAEAFRNGHSPQSSVALVDDNRLPNHFTSTCLSRNGHGLPSWTQGSMWGVKIGPKTTRTGRTAGCANQLAADFGRNYGKHQERGWFPWGPPRGWNGVQSSEKLPQCVQLPNSTTTTLARLNAGPNLAEALADTAHAAELPTGSRISWIRVSPEPMGVDFPRLERIVNAFAAFEQACDKLVDSDPHVANLLLAGVHVDPALRDAYLHPPTSQFSVRRPDLHIMGDRVFASENDEMPGGFADQVHYDLAYSVNKERWQQCFNWLCSEGTLVFLVSDQWSRCYIPEMQWLTETLAERGYSVKLLTTSEANQIQVRTNGVWHGEDRIGTIWRQFPIFEAQGPLVDLVLAAQAGAVRMVPELGHFGNKAWFSVYRSHRAGFAKLLDTNTLATLDEVLPDSHLVRASSDFPLTLNLNGREWTAYTVEDLANAPQWVRDAVVVKIVGANDMAARSYGVLIGSGIQANAWKHWVMERMAANQPFIVQQRLEPSVMQMPVYNTGRGVAEDFHCRVLIRPWQVGGQLVSASVCAVPKHLHKVHGMVDMCATTVDLSK